ncbi:MAG: hypothetical protein ABIK92_17905 [Pseudomonadota bacterium]
MKRKELRHKFFTSQIVIRILFCILVATFLTSCGTKFIRKGGTYPPYAGEVRVFWKDHGVPADPNSYEFIGTVSGRSTWCGITQGKFNEGLHKKLTEQAGNNGGNGIILYCGEIGTVGECYCYGDVIRFK